MNKFEKNQHFDSEVLQLDQELNNLKGEVQALQHSSSKKSNLAIYHDIRIIYVYIKIIELLSQKNLIYEKVFNLGHIQSLDLARKYLGLIFSLLQRIVYSNLNVSFVEISEKLDKVPLFNPKLRVKILYYLFNTITSLEKLIGSNSKWKWSFTGFWYEFSIILRNMIHYKEITSSVDPNDPFIKDNEQLFHLYNKVSLFATTELRSRFELSTKSPNDLIKAMNLLTALKLTISFLNKKDELLSVKNKIDVLKIMILKRKKD